MLRSKTKSEHTKYRKSNLERSDWDVGGDDRDCGSSLYREPASQSIEQGLWGDSYHNSSPEGIYVPGSEWENWKH